MTSIGFRRFCIPQRLIAFPIPKAEFILKEGELDDWVYCSLAAYSTEIQFETRGEQDVIDITQQVEARVKSSGVRQGLVTIFCPGSTAAVTTMEFEPGLVKDLPAALERVAPRKGTYQHQLKWHDDNGHSHVRAALFGPSITLPVVDGSLPLGQWQQIVFLEFDARARQRRLVIQVVGD